MIISIWKESSSASPPSISISWAPGGTNLVIFNDFHQCLTSANLLGSTPTGSGVTVAISQTVPGGHGLHMDSPHVSAYVPFGHGMQAGSRVSPAQS